MTCSGSPREVGETALEFYSGCGQYAESAEQVALLQLIRPFPRKAVGKGARYTQATKTSRVFKLPIYGKGNSMP